MTAPGEGAERSRMMEHKIVGPDGNGFYWAYGLNRHKGPFLTQEEAERQLVQMRQEDERKVEIWKRQAERLEHR